MPEMPNMAPQVRYFDEQGRPTVAMLMFMAALLAHIDERLKAAGV